MIKSKSINNIERAVKKWCDNKTSENLEDFIITIRPYVKAISFKVINTIPAVLSGEDLIQYGLLGALYCLKKYNLTKGVSFKTFSYLRIRGAMQDAIRKLSSTSRTRNVPMVSYDLLKYAIADQNQDMLIGFASNEISHTLSKALGLLSFRQQIIIMFLLNGLKTKHIANILEISISRIQQERKTAIEILSEALSNSLDNTIRDILR